jgi:hypothetical protein
MGLQPKADSEQFEEAINLVDTPIESMNHLAAERKLKSFNLHRTGSKDGYEPANNHQISSKNLDYQSKSEEITEDNFVKSIKDDKSSSVSDQLLIQPKNNSTQCNEADNLVDNPTQLLNLLATVRELKSINLHRTRSKRCYRQAIQFLLSSKNLFCR